MLLTAVNLVAGTGSDNGTDINGYLRRLGIDIFLHDITISNTSLTYLLVTEYTTALLIAVT